MLVFDTRANAMLAETHAIEVQFKTLSAGDIKRLVNVLTTGDPLTGGALGRDGLADDLSKRAFDVTEDLRGQVATFANSPDGVARGIADIFEPCPAKLVSTADFCRVDVNSGEVRYLMRKMSTALDRAAGDTCVYSCMTVIVGFASHGDPKAGLEVMTVLVVQHSIFFEEVYGVYMYGIPFFVLIIVVTAVLCLAGTHQFLVSFGVPKTSLVIKSDKDKEKALLTRTQRLKKRVSSAAMSTASTVKRFSQETCHWFFLYVLLAAALTAVVVPLGWYGLRIKEYDADENEVPIPVSQAGCSSTLTGQNGTSCLPDPGYAIRVPDKPRVMAGLYRGLLAALELGASVAFCWFLWHGTFDLKEAFGGIRCFRRCMLRTTGDDDGNHGNDSNDLEDPKEGGTESKTTTSSSGTTGANKKDDDDDDDDDGPYVDPFDERKVRRVLFGVGGGTVLLVMVLAFISQLVETPSVDSCAGCASGVVGSLENGWCYSPIASAVGSIKIVLYLIELVVFNLPVFFLLHALVVRDRASYMYAVLMRNRHVGPWALLLVLIGYIAVVLLYTGSDVPLQLAPVVFLLATIFLFVDHYKIQRRNMDAKLPPALPDGMPHFAYVLILQYAMIFGPFYLGKSSFKLMRCAYSALEDYVWVNAAPPAILFFVLYLFLSFVLQFIIGTLASWTVPSPLFQKRLLILPMICEELFCQSLFPGVKSLGVLFFLMMLFRFAKAVILRTGMHFVCINYTIENAASCFSRGKELHERLKKKSKALLSTDKMVTSFIISEQLMLAELVAAISVIAALLLELLRITTRESVSCDHIYFLIHAKSSSDIPLLIANCLLMLMVAVVSQSIAGVIWHNQFERLKAEVVVRRRRSLTRRKSIENLKNSLAGLKLEDHLADLAKQHEQDPAAGGSEDGGVADSPRPAEAAESKGMSDAADGSRPIESPRMSRSRARSHDGTKRAKLQKVASSDRSQTGSFKAKQLAAHKSGVDLMLTPGMAESEEDIEHFYNTPITTAKRQFWLRMRNMTALFVLFAVVGVTSTVMKLYANDKHNYFDVTGSSKILLGGDYWRCSDLWQDVVLRNPSNSSRYDIVSLNNVTCQHTCSA
eukprot:g62.t1